MKENYNYAILAAHVMFVVLMLYKAESIIQLTQCVKGALKYYNTNQYTLVFMVGQFYHQKKKGFARLNFLL